MLSLQFFFFLQKIYGERIVLSLHFIISSLIYFIKWFLLIYKLLITVHQGYMRLWNFISPIGMFR